MRPPKHHHDDDCPEDCETDHAAQWHEAKADHLADLAEDDRDMEINR